MKSARRLRLVSESQRLRGIGSTTFERMVARAEMGDRAHRGLTHTMATLAGPVVRVCVPPSAQSELWAGLDAARCWVTRGLGKQAIASARARAFGAVSAIEELTERAVLAASARMDSQAATPLDEHATRVTVRYSRLGAHFACSAVCHTLDGILQPTTLLDVYADLQAARAYQLTGLGAARHAPFRQAAWEQAKWELSSHNPESSSSSLDTQSVGPLAVQIFHEYLGGRYRAQAQGVRASLDAFIEWALSATAKTGHR